MSLKSLQLSAFMQRVVIVIIATLVICTGYLWIAENPQRLADQGRAALPANPVQAERLLGRAISSASGTFPEALVLRARAFQLSNRPYEALGTFSLITDPSQCNVQDLIDLADAAGAQGNVALQRNALQAAHRPGPGQIEVLHRLIPLESAQLRSESVLKLCRELIQLDDQDPLPWYVMALIFKERKLVAEGIHHCRESLKRNPSQAHTAEIRGLLASLLIDSGNVPQARQEVDASLKINPDSSSLQLTNAFLLRMEGHAADALRVVDRMVRENRDVESRALMLRGILLLDTGHPESAKDDLERVVESQPFNKEAHYKLGQTCQKLNQPQQAEVHFARSRELTEAALKILSVEDRLQAEPNNPELVKQLTELYETVGRNQRTPTVNPEAR